MLTAGFLCHLELGDIEAADVAIAAHNRLAEEARQPFYRYVNTAFRPCGRCWMAALQRRSAWPSKR